MAQSVQVQKLNHWHLRLADWLILNPSRSLGEAAKEFNVTLSWLSVVKNSDAFIDHFQRLSAEHSSALLLTVRDKAAAVADMALDEISRQLAQSSKLDAPSIPYAQLLETADTMLKRSGYGEAAGRAPQVNQVTIGLASKGELEEARIEMRKRARSGLAAPQDHAEPSPGGKAQPHIIDLTAKREES